MGVEAVIYCASGSSWIGENGSYDVDYMVRGCYRGARRAASRSQMQHPQAKPFWDA